MAPLKEQVKAQSWREALTTLDQLDAESAKPGNETAHQQLVAPVAFYRGVCEANLDHVEKAEAAFAIFLQEKPGSSIDNTVYSKKAVAAFQAASKEPPPPAALSMLQRYEEFKAPPNMGEPPDERWADGPVKWIMTPEESAAWRALTSGGERAEFVEKFWQARNPKPGSDDNPARTGFDRRVAFADAYFQVDEKKRGSLTDPGMVFVILGPPTRTGRKPIKTGEDQLESDGMTNAAIWWMSNRNSVHPDPTAAADVTNSFREIWQYRREALPKGVSINELNVTFITRSGIGRFVLQRDPAVLSALKVAKGS